MKKGSSTGRTRSAQAPARGRGQGATKEKAAPAGGDGRMKRQFLKTKECYRVTFRLPADAAREAENVALVGDFNSWDPGATPLKRLKSGSTVSGTS